MFRVVICEDDFVCRNLLKDYLETILKDFTNQFEILEFTSGEELIDSYPEGIDIFFLDIEMQNFTGMDVARKIRDVDTRVEIIFTTALLNYIQDGYEVRAYRYLIKPIKFDELKKHVNSCIEEIIKRTEQNLIIQNKSAVYKIPIDDITYIEVRNKDITVHTIDGSYYTKMSMSNMENELEKYNFFRCHKSYLVNMKHIQCMKQNVILIDGIEVPISRHRIKDFKVKLVNLLGDVIC
ncbi:MAG: LytTR family DNA-binding domain-containing protein [Peptostreptococcaceae bacterium]|nr:LytTR family DNA-binding domain-containing protein [Peptostreptococcaceae bacterium]